MARIDLESVVQEVDGHRLLDGVDLSVEDGEFLMLAGPSGSGKTSIIRTIAGFDELTSGRVLFDGADMTDIPTRDRDIGVIFQGDTLFPTHKVRRNLSFPLRNRAVRRDEIRKRVEAESRAHDIQHILERWPATLSGGEKKLAQIARALVRVPQVFLMDEPLSRLDPPTRSRLRQELVTLQKGYNVTVIYASNSPTEIMEMPDRLAAIEGGRVTQVGTPTAIQRSPVSRSIAQLTGPIGMLDATVETAPEGFWIVGDGWRLKAWPPILENHIGEPVTIGARSSDVRIDTDGPLPMTTGRITYEWSSKERLLRSNSGTLTTGDTDGGEDKAVNVRLDRWHLFDPTGHRITTVE